MTEQIVKDFLAGKIERKDCPPCFMSLSCPSDSVHTLDRHPARDCRFFAICYMVRGRYDKYREFLRNKKEVE